MRTDQAVLITDHGSTEDSRHCLKIAVERLTGRPPRLLDARHFMPGGSGQVVVERDEFQGFRVPGEDSVVTPAAVILYEIPPHKRRGLEDFQRLLRRLGVPSLGLEADGWRTATEKDLAVEAFRRDAVPHVDTIVIPRHYAGDLEAAFERLGGNVWAKPNVGMGGADVFHVTSNARLHEAARYYAESAQGWQMSRDAENFDKDGRRHQYRVIVLDGVAIQACENVQWDAELPCNECQGAVSTLIGVEELPAGLDQLAVSATKSMGLSFGGVDLVAEHGGAVLEVNVHPAMTGPQRPIDMAMAFVAAHLPPQDGAPGA